MVTSSAKTTLSPTSPTFVVLLGALTATTALSIDMNLPAMPHLQRIFHATTAATQLTLSLFLLGYAVGQTICGPLSDRIGRKPVLLIALSCYTLMSVGCACSHSLTWLVIFRMLQGLAASAGPVVSRAIVRDCFEQEHAAATLSHVTQMMIIAPLVAPTIGGFLLVHLGWQTIFGTLAATGALLLVLSARFLGETRSANRSTNAVSLATGFRIVLSDPVSLRYTLVACFTNSGMLGYVSGSPFVIIGLFHVPQDRFGFVFALTAISVMTGVTLNRRLLPTIGSMRLLRAGAAAVTLGGILLIACACLKLGGLVGLIGPMMIYLLGLGLVMANAIAAAMQPHPEIAGVASSLIGGLQTAGGALAGYCIGAFYAGNTMSLAITVGLLALASGTAVAMPSRARQLVIPTDAAMMIADAEELVE